MFPTITTHSFAGLSVSTWILIVSAALMALGIIFAIIQAFKTTFLRLVQRPVNFIFSHCHYHSLAILQYTPSSSELLGDPEKDIESPKVSDVQNILPTLQYVKRVVASDTLVCSRSLSLHRNNQPIYEETASVAHRPLQPQVQHKRNTRFSFFGRNNDTLQPSALPPTGAPSPSKKRFSFLTWTPNEIAYPPSVTHWIPPAPVSRGIQQIQPPRYMSYEPGEKLVDPMQIQTKKPRRPQQAFVRSPGAGWL